MQVLGTAAVWQALRDFWGLDGAAAAAAVTTAIDLLLAAAARPLMDLLTGVNHIAVLTADLDRFVDFYADVFDVDVVFSETTPAFRHAILRTGATSWLHPAELADNPHGTASPTMFDRGHLDHLALTAATPRRSRRSATASSRGARRTARSTTSAPSTACGSTIPTACASSSSSSSTSGCRASTPRNR